MEEDYPTARFLRLKTGDDIVAEVVEIEDESGLLYMVHNPLKVVYIPSEQPGYLIVSFAPWVFTSICDSQEFTLDSKDILTISDVSAKMNEYYWQHQEDIINVKQETSKERQEQAEQPQPEPEDHDLLIHKRTYH